MSSQPDEEKKLQEWKETFKRPQPGMFDGEYEEVRDFLQIITLLKDNNVEQLDLRLHRLSELLEHDPSLRALRFDPRRLDANSRGTVNQILLALRDGGDIDGARSAVIALLADEEFYNRSIRLSQEYLERCLDIERKRSVRFALFFLKGRNHLKNHAANNPLLEMIYALSIQDDPLSFTDLFSEAGTEFERLVGTTKDNEGQVNREILRLEAQVLEAIFARRIELPIYFDELLPFYLYQKRYNEQAGLNQERFLTVFKTDFEVCLREKFIKRVREMLTFPLEYDGRLLEILLFFFSSGLLRVPFFLCFTAFKHGDYFIRFHEEHKHIQRILLGEDTRQAVLDYAGYYLERGYRDVYERVWVKIDQFEFGHAQES